MKTKSFHYSKSGVAQPIAAAIGTQMQCVCDKMPPAYPCDGEKVVFIGIEMKGKLPSVVADFCKELYPIRTKGVAFYVINSTGSSEGIEKAVELINKNKVQQFGETLCINVKSSLFSKGKPTADDIEKAVNWAKDIAAKY